MCNGYFRVGIKVAFTMFGIGSKIHGNHTTIALQVVQSIGRYGGSYYEENGIHKFFKLNVELYTNTDDADAELNALLSQLKYSR